MGCVWGVVIGTQEQLLPTQNENLFGLQSVWEGPGGSLESPRPPYKLFVSQCICNVFNMFLLWPIVSPIELPIALPIVLPIELPLELPIELPIGPIAHCPIVVSGLVLPTKLKLRPSAAS